MTETNEPRFYTARMLAEAANVSSSYVARLCRQGQIPAEKIGHTWIIDTKTAAAFLAERKNTKTSSEEH
jgi:hypothetical protein